MRSAQTSKFFINTGGELFHGGTLLKPGYVPTPDEEWVIDKCAELQRGANWGRFRVYGGLWGDRSGFDTAEVIVVTEFAELVADKEYWDAVRSFARATGAYWWMMRRDRVRDRTTYVGGPEKGKVVIGPNHGKLEMQVELSWRVEALDLMEFEHLIHRLTKASAELWKKGGVGVC